MMVKQTLKLQDSFKDYNAKMQRSTNFANSKVCLNDITSNNWAMSIKIKAFSSHPLLPLSK